MQPQTTLWLIRHAEVEEAYHSIFGGRIDMGLSPRGNQQAQVLARFLHDQGIKALYASPMKRVRETLKPFLEKEPLEPLILQDLREVDFGDWTGLHWNEVQERYGVSALTWLDELERDGRPNAESGRALRSRVEPCLRQILREQPGGQVAVACHGGVIRMLLSILLSLPLPQMATFEVDYASATQVLWTPQLATLIRANFAPWRESIE